VDSPLSLRNIGVSFGAVRALSDVDFDVNAGEVVALVGDNGAGKSTLVKVMSGIRPPNTGEIYFRGSQVTFATPREAHAAGITTGHQDLALCDNLDVVANLFLGQEMLGSTGLDEDRMEVRAKELIGSLGVTTIADVRAEVARLSGGQRQSIAIARALVGQPQVVLLDEPTAALGVTQTHEVLALVERLRARGLGVVLITHNMQNVLAVSNRIHVLLHGRTNGVFRTADVTAQDVVSAITGATRHGSQVNAQ
jgi:D-xylose transport system ATP-binding protein